MDELVNNDQKIETSREASEWLSGLSEKAIDELVSVSGEDDCNESLTKFMREDCLEKFDTFMNEEIPVSSSLKGEFNKNNMKAAKSILKACGVSDKSITSTLSMATSIPGRFFKTSSNFLSEPVLKESAL